MAELALGAISLGIQVCGGISTYVGALRDRSDNLASVACQCDTLKTALTTISASIDQAQSAPGDKSIETARQCLQTCKVELDVLATLAAKLSDCQLSDPGFIEKMKARAKKATYPFHRGDISRVETHLAKAIGILQLGLQGLGLDASQQTAQQIATLHSEVTTLAPSIATLQNELPTLRHSMNGVESQVISQSDAISSQIVSLSHQSDETKVSIHQRFDDLESMVKRALAPESLGPNTTYTAVERLVFRPSNLRMLSDEVVRFNQSLSTDSADNLTRELGIILCPCRPHTTRRRRVLSLYPFWLSNQVSTIRDHQPGCRYYTDNNDTSKSSSAIKLIGLQRVIKAAIGISFNWERGSGGFGLTSNLDYHPSVDERTAPVFRVLAHLRNFSGMLFRARLDSVREQAMEDMTQMAISKIYELYLAGKASPKDITAQEGQTVLFAALNLCLSSSFHHGILGPFLKQLIISLISMKVPARVFDHSGGTAADLLWRFRYSTYSSTEFEITKHLLINGGELSDRARGRMFDETRWLWGLFRTFEQSSETAQMFGCGPLSMAILREDEQATKHILEKQRSSLDERNYFGQTPLHLAVHSQPCLQLLATYCSRDNFMAEDQSFLKPLDYAVIWGKNICPDPRSGSLENTTHCVCTSSLNILLDSNMPLLTHRGHEYGYYLPRLLRRSSDHCRALFVRQLRRRRQALQRLAEENLPPQDRKALKLRPDVVLDAFAIYTQHAIEKQGVVVPDELLIELPADKKSGWSYGTIYHELMAMQDAQAFYDAGFREINPPFQSADYGWSYSSLDIRYVEWLIQHNADLSPWNERRYGERCESMLLKKSCHCHILSRPVSTCLPLPLPVMDHLLSAEWTGESCCRCSTSRCHPFVCLVGEWVSHGLYNYGYWMGRANPSHHLQRIFDWFCHKNNRFARDHHRAAIRIVTFSVLEAWGLLVHTCPCKNSRLYIDKRGESIQSSPENTEEIEDEDPEAIEQFEVLISELEQECLGQEGDPLPDASKMEQFWKDSWPRMTKDTVRSLFSTKMTKEEFRATEHLGVTWEHGTDLTDQIQDSETDLSESEGEDEDENDEDFVLERVVAPFRTELENI